MAQQYGMKSCQGCYLSSVCAGYSEWLEVVLHVTWKEYSTFMRKPGQRYRDVAALLQGILGGKIRLIKPQRMIVMLHES